jgi:putative flippase GtrA
MLVFSSCEHARQAELGARTPFAYVTVAGFCIILHNAVMIIADAGGMALWAAVLLSFTIVASAGYALHCAVTFRQPLALRGFARYTVAMSANVPLAFVTTWFWHEWVGLSMPVAAPLASVCMLAVNFMLGRWAIVAPNPRSPAAR